jgi:hypothetical protein
MQKKTRTTGASCGDMKIRSESLAHNGSRRGSVFYIVILILSTLMGIAYSLLDIGVSETHATQLAYRSEVAINLGEAVIEEIFRNVEMMMNSGGKGPVGGVYDRLRSQVPSGGTIQLSSKDHIVRFLAPNSLQLCKELKSCEAIVEAVVRDIQPININPKMRSQDGTEKARPGVRIDKIEKDAVLEVKVRVIYEEYQKSLVVTRSLKVVNTTMAPLAPFTLFVNEPGFPVQSQWSSKLGMAYHDRGHQEREQTSLILDHSWDDALGKEQIHADELLKGFEDRVLQGQVPPGRVFMNSAIVPLTHGNLESGMLQNAFFMAETELLPPASVTDLEKKDNWLNRAGSKLTETEKKLLTDILPSHGKLFTRFLGHGAELRLGEFMEVNGKKRLGFGSYFEAFKSAWKTGSSPKNPSNSGLDLLGRVEYKPGALDEEDEKTGIFGKILDVVGDVADAVLKEFVNKNYNLRVSPTFIYGKVLSSYFQVMDFKYTRGSELKEVWKRRRDRDPESKGFWSSLWSGVTEISAKLLSTVRIGFLGPGQVPIPQFDEAFLNGISESEMGQPFEKKDRKKFLAMGWSKKTFEQFLDLPEGLRTPAFFSFLAKVRSSQQEYFGQSLKDKISKGAILAPYNHSVLNYLKPDFQNSLLMQVLTDPSKGLAKLSPTGQLFFDNPVDQRLSTEWGGEYRSPLEESLEPEMPLKNFNPFLYYRKATDYISSIYDYRQGEKGKGVNVFKQKYYDQKDHVLDLNGVIYITGTARPLRFSEYLGPGKQAVVYRGKSIIITFGEVIFDCSVRKDGFNKQGFRPRFGVEAPLLTIVALGGVQFTPPRERAPVTVEATVYSFMFPPRANHEFRLHGTLGASELKLSFLPRGGIVKFDPSFDLRDLPPEEKKSYYWVALTNEIKKYSWKAGW